MRAAHRRLGWLLTALLGSAASSCVGPGLDPPERRDPLSPGVNGPETRQDAGQPAVPPSQPGSVDGGADTPRDAQAGEQSDDMDAGGP